MAALAALAACSTVSGATEPAEIVWTAPEADRVAHLTRAPATCTRPQAEPAAAARGALLFASPALLGGQAAKAGLSCASCHVNGRGNPAFVFPGISGAQGTADVTHGLFGPARDDGVFNPVTIPDLAVREARTLDREDRAAVDSFLRAQIAEEFEGAPPSGQMLRDLGAYLRSLDASTCNRDADFALRPEADLDAAIAAYRAAIDPALPAAPDGSAYARTARHFLGRLHARYPAPGDAALRETLVIVSRQIAAGAPEGDVLAALDDLRSPLARSEPRSLYAPAVLQDWLARAPSAPRRRGALRNHPSPEQAGR